MRTLTPKKSLLNTFLFSLLSIFTVSANAEYINWESPHVNPMDLTPDNNTLLVVNTADAKLEVFEFVNGIPSLTNSIPVGLDPVSVRARNNTEAWVVNHVSDSISIVDLTRGIVTHTLKTEDEPADVIFAGTANRAFVTASQANMVQVFNPDNLSTAPTNISILGEDPRTLAISPDGNTVYAAIFESGNASTIIRGGRDIQNRLATTYGGVDDASSPYASQNPPPNNGNNFSPAINPAVASDIPEVSMIVKKDASGRWMDDNNGDWSEMIAGDLKDGFNFNHSGRVPGWDMPDNDIAIINANNLSLTYQSGLMNMVMGLAVNPANGRVTTVGTEAHNEVRYEPNLRSHFITVTYADFVSGNTNSKRILDLNPHINRNVEFLSRAQREESLGDPRHITWDNSGNGFITGMGSSTLVRVNSNGVRNGNVASVKVGKGPTASIIRNNNIIVLNRFDASLSVVAANTFTETTIVDFYDPTPEEINIGRVQFYDTHETSGMGQLSCASCHVDGKQDRLVWDLGNPAGDYTFRNGIQFHPMKGPLRTTSLAGVVGSPALHFRGDKEDIAGFNGTFTNLQGLNAARTDQQMTELETFIGSMHTPPNPFRNIDNTMPDQLTIPGPGGRVGNPNLSAGADGCNRCHVVADNGRSDVRGQVAGFNSPGQQPTTAPSLRSMYEILGFTYSLQNQSTAGFGFIADGVMDSLTQATLSNNDSFAFMMAYNGDLPFDTHAGVGTQVTLNGEQTADDRSTLDRLVELAEADEIGLIAHGLVESKAESAGFTYLSGSGGRYQTQTVGNTITHAVLSSNASASNPVTFTAVPKGSEIRAGIDRDENGISDDVVTVPSRIQAEAFVNAFDTTAGTQRGAGFLAGYEHVNVDITDSGAGTPQVGWITAGEWLEYNIYSEVNQSLNLVLHAGSQLNGQTVNVLLNGNRVGTINITNTGGFSNFQITEALQNISLSADTHYVLRLEFQTGGLDLNYLELTTDLPTPPTTPENDISIDGNINEWNASNILPIDPDDIATGNTNIIDFRRAGISHNQNQAYIFIENRNRVDPDQTSGTFLPWGWQVFIDTDQNPSTGYNVSDVVGADYILEGNVIQRYNGSGTDWNWSIISSAETQFNNTTIEMGFDRNLIGNPESINVVFQGANAVFGGSTLDVYPDDANDPSASIRYFTYEFGESTPTTNTAPVAVNQGISVESNTSDSFALNATDAENNSLTVQITNAPSNGNLQINGLQVQFTPNQNYTGADSFSYRASDGIAVSNVATVTINVVAPNTSNVISNSVTNAAITVNGNNSEWSNLDLYATDPNDIATDNSNHINWAQAGIAHSNDTVYLMYRNHGNINPIDISGTFLQWGWQAFLDTDNDSSTGYTQTNITTGADILIEGNRVYRFGGGDSWNWIDIGPTTLSYNNSIAELSFSRSLLGAHDLVNVVFYGNNQPFGGNTIDSYPNAGNFEYFFDGGSFSASAFNNNSPNLSRSPASHEPTSNETSTTTPTAVTESNSGGGSMSWALLLSLSLLFLKRIQATRKKYLSQSSKIYLHS